MAVIHKQVLKPDADGRCTISVPKDVELLHVAAQFDDLCVWYLCDPGWGLREIELLVVPTGGTVPDIYKPVGTALMYGGQYVWHVFQNVLIK